MARFSIRNPYFIVVICLALAVVGVNAPLRVSVFRARARLLPGAFSVVRGRNDRDSFVLFTISQGSSWRVRRIQLETTKRWASSILGRPFQCMVQSQIQYRAGFLRTLGPTGIEASGTDVGAAPGNLCGESCHLSFAGTGVLPQDRCGTVHRDPTGSRIEVTNDYVARIEDLIRQIVAPKDLNMVLSNIGVVNDISSLYTSIAGMYTATIQVALDPDHSVSSFDYMDQVKAAIAAKSPAVRTFFQSGSIQDAILNQGQPAPIDVQVNTRDLGLTYATAQNFAERIRQIPGVGQIYTFRRT